MTVQCVYLIDNNLTQRVKEKTRTIPNMHTYMHDFTHIIFQYLHRTTIKQKSHALYPFSSLLQAHHTGNSFKILYIRRLAPFFLVVSL